MFLIHKPLLKWCCRYIAVMIYGASTGRKMKDFVYGNLNTFDCFTHIQVVKKRIRKFKRWKILTEVARYSQERPKQSWLIVTEPIARLSGLFAMWSNKTVREINQLNDLPTGTISCPVCLYIQTQNSISTGLHCWGCCLSLQYPAILVTILWLNFPEVN